MAVVGLTGAGDGKGGAKGVTTANTISGGLAWSFEYDNTQITTVSQLKAALREIEERARGTFPKTA